MNRNLTNTLTRLRIFLSSRESKLAKFGLNALSMTRKLLVLCRLYGARIVVESNPEMTQLKLNRSTSLGIRGELIKIPSDNTISNFIRERGTWEIDECRFLAHEINLLGYQRVTNEKSLLLDIGANAGLISRQIRNMLDFDIDMILIEPIPLHVRAIEFNLSKFLSNPRVRVFQGALSNTTGSSKIYIQSDNRGNTSLFRNAMLGHSSREIEIDLIDTEKFSSSYLEDYSNIVLKSDTQGYDAHILSLIPINIWQKINTAVIEIWALPDIDNKDITRLISIWQKLPDLKFFTTSPHEKELSLDKIGNLWSSKSGKSFNLRVSRMKASESGTC